MGRRRTSISLGQGSESVRPTGACGPDLAGAGDGCERAASRDSYSAVIVSAVGLDLSLQGLHEGIGLTLAGTIRRRSGWTRVEDVLVDYLPVENRCYRSNRTGTSTRRNCSPLSPIWPRPDCDKFGYARPEQKPAEAAAV